MKKYASAKTSLELTPHALWVYQNTQPLEIYEGEGFWKIEDADGGRICYQAKEVSEVLEEMYPYAILDSGFITEYAVSLQDAQETIELYEDQDLEDGSYRENRYTIKEV